MATPTIVQSKYVQCSAGTGNATFDNPTTSDNLLVAFIAQHYSVSFYTLNHHVTSDTFSNAWTSTGPQYDGGGGAYAPSLLIRYQENCSDLWVTDAFGDFEFSPPRPVAELNTPDNVEAGPFIRHDGLEIFFRGPTIFDIFTATRGDPGEPWSTPIRIDAPISSEFNEQAPKLSKDGQTLLFSSNRPGTLGNLDIWMATRAKMTGNP